MLSLTQCRELLPASEAGISDAELDRLRHQLYELAQMMLDVVTLDQHPPSPAAPSAVRLDPDPAGAYHPGDDA